MNAMRDVCGVTATDLYEVTMALAYLRQHKTAPATFSLFARRLPPDRGFLIAAGLADVLDFLEGFEVRKDDLAVFAKALRRPVHDLAPLAGLRFDGDVWAVPEGRVVHGSEPLLEVTAPLPQAQLVETWVLNQVTHQTALASKAARCVLAAAGRPVIDFALRRTHGIEAGMHAARAAAIVGFASTSNVAAAGRYGLPASGTMAHSFVQAFDTETEAFAAFAAAARGPVTLLVDTYDTERGVHNAVGILRAVPPGRDIGVRLDSGDLADLAVRARHLLDDAGLHRARIVASGGLDEYEVARLVAAEAPIDIFAVGTKVGTSADMPYLDTAYKLVEYDGRPVMKLSTGKLTTPGAKQVYRHLARAERADLIATRTEHPPTDSEPLLELVLRGGRRRAPRQPAGAEVDAARRRFHADLAQLPPATRAIHRPRQLQPRLSPRLRACTNRLREQIRETTLGPDLSGAIR